jgi:hypothetical protein
VTPAINDLPENFERWPRSVQLRYLEELHAIYYPDTRTAADTPPAIQGEVID